jgi:hypothetical protein
MLLLGEALLTNEVPRGCAVDLPLLPRALLLLMMYVKSLRFFIYLQGFLKWPSDTTKWPASSSEASAACSAAAASAGVSSADNALPPSMFFVDLSLGPSGVALLSQLVCARVELMLTRAAVLRDRGLLPEVQRGGTQSVIVCISHRSLPSFCFVTLGFVYLCL